MDCENREAQGHVDEDWPKKQREPLSLLRSGLLKASRSHCGPILELTRAGELIPDVAYTALALVQ